MKSFINYSEKLGKNFLLCQGPGGNTSIKVNKDIYIKKSGSYLSDANSKNIFKNINLLDAKNFYINRINKNKKFDEDLSIETPLHVMLNKKYVFHYHSIFSIIISAMFKQSEINSLLLKNKILPIKYIRPGLELAEEIINQNIDSNFNCYFLYNHGMVVEGNNMKELYKKILDIESLFLKFLDYNKLKFNLNSILSLTQVENKITNPIPKLNYKLFNQKYLFPDHSVFFPKFFENDKTLNESIYYDEDYFYFEHNLSKTELIYFKVLLLIFSVIEDKKIYNYINKKTGKTLRESKDEQLRIGINK